MASYEELIAKARELHAAGDIESAKRVAQIAVKRRDQPKQDKSLMTTVKENILGDDDPTTQNFGEKLGTFLNKAGESMTFGLIGDEADAAVAGMIPGGMGYDERLEQQRQQEALFEKTNPGAAFGADIGGAVLGAALPFGAIGTLGKGAGLLPRMGASMATGAGMGGTYGFMEGEGTDDRLNDAYSGAVFGAGAGLAAPLVGAGVQKVADKVVGNRTIRAAAKNAKSAAQTRASSGQAYDAFEDAGAEISPEAMSRLRQALDAKLPKSGLGSLPGAANRTPGGQQILNTVGQMDDQVRAAAAAGKKPAVPLKTIEELRRFAGDVAQDVNPIGRATADARMGSIAIDEIDSFVNSLQAADVPIGDANVANAALKKARELWATASKTQLIENVLENQDDYLGGSASAIRNKISALLKNKKTRRQFSDAEKVVLRKIIGGNGLTRAIRLMGNGIGRQAQMVGGASFGGIPGALAGMATGELSAAAADRGAIRAAELARDIMANGGIQSLPAASDTYRKLTEGVMRRYLAVGPQ